MRGASMLWRGPAAPHLIAYRAEVVHFSADAQSGTVRLLHRIRDTAAEDAAAADEELDTDEGQPSPVSASFTAQQVFLPEPRQFMSKLQGGAALDGAASCMYPCALSCGCPMVALVKRPPHTSDADATRATPSPVNAMHVYRLFVHPDTRRPVAHSYYALLPVSTYERWRRDGSDVIDEVLKGAGPQRHSRLQRQYRELSSSDVEALTLLGLADILGSASEDTSETQGGSRRIQSSDDTCPGTIDAVDAIPM